MSRPGILDKKTGVGVVNGYNIGPGADLRKAKLRYTNLRYADLRGADLRGADLEGAYLQDALLNDANLEGATTYLAVFAEADLTGANLSRLNATETCFSGALLYGANVEGAVLDQCNFFQAGLQGVDLYTARGITGAIFNYASVERHQVDLIKRSLLETLHSLKLDSPRKYSESHAKRIGRTSNPDYGYNYEEDPYDDAAGGFGYGRVMNPGHRHHRRGYGR